MLTDDFINASREMTTKVDLTAAEVKALDDLGPTIGFNNSFAATFSHCISRGIWELDQTWGYNDKDGNRINQYESVLEFTLYTPIENGGFGRIPKVHFAYWKNKPDQSKEMMLDVDYIPAYLASAAGSNSNMTAIVRTITDESVDIIECTQSQNVIRALRGEVIHRGGTVLGSALKFGPQ